MPDPGPPRLSRGPELTVSALSHTYSQGSLSTSRCPPPRMQPPTCLSPFSPGDVQPLQALQANQGRSANSATQEETKQLSPKVGKAPQRTSPQKQTWAWVPPKAPRIMTHWGSVRQSHSEPLHPNRNGYHQREAESGACVASVWKEPGPRVSPAGLWNSTVTLEDWLSLETSETSPTIQYSTAGYLHRRVKAEVGRLFAHKASWHCSQEPRGGTSSGAVTGAG